MAENFHKHEGEEQTEWWIVAPQAVYFKTNGKAKVKVQCAQCDFETMVEFDGLFNHLSAIAESVEAVK